MLQHLLYYSAVGRDVNLSSLFSLIPLYRVSYLPPLFPYFSPSLASMLLLFMSAISSLYARYLFGLKPNIYRTSTGHLPNMNRSYSFALSLLHWATYWLYWRCSFDWYDFCFPASFAKRCFSWRERLFLW